VTLSRSSVLFYNDFAAGPEAEVGGPFHFSRDSSKWVLGRDGLYHQARAGQYGMHWENLVGQASAPPYRRPALLVEPGYSDNIVGNTAEFVTASGWNISSYSAVAATSIFADAAMQGWAAAFTWSSGGGAIYKGAGNLSGSKETYVCICEEVSAGRSIGAIRDNSMGSEYQVQMDWSTYTVTDHGPLALDDFGYVDMGRGPNGGRLFLLWFMFTGTSGNLRQIKFYPDADKAGDTTILHYCNVQDKAGFGSLLPGDGSTTLSRATEVGGQNVYWDAFQHLPAAGLAFYWEYIFHGVWATYSDTIRLGDDSSGYDPHVRCEMHNNFPDTSLYFVYHESGGQVARSQAITGIQPGDRIQQVGVIFNDGSIMQISAHEGGQATGTGVSAALSGGYQTLGHPAVSLVPFDAASVGALALKVVDLGDLDSAGLLGPGISNADAQTVLDELADFHLDAAAY